MNVDAAAHEGHRTYTSQLSDDDARKITPGFHMTIIVMPDNDGWTALAMPFDIAGWGTHPEAAIHDTIALVEDYLTVGFSEGLAFSEMFRPAPRRYWLRIIAHMIRRMVTGGKPPRRTGRRGSIIDEVPLIPCDLVPA